MFLVQTIAYFQLLGRSWAITELRDKSWDDLHKLWWVCIKERNRIATSNMERDRLKAGYGEHEAEGRDKTVSSLLFGQPLPIFYCHNKI